VKRRALKELHNLASFCQKVLVQFQVVYGHLAIMRPLPSSEPADLRCERARRVSMSLPPAAPAAWTYFAIAVNAPVRHGSDCVFFLSFPRESYSGLRKALQKSARGAPRTRHRDFAGRRVDDPALVVPTVPVLAQMATHFETCKPSYVTRWHGSAKLLASAS
jgi:hypothetical protein